MPLLKFKFNFKFSIIKENAAVCKSRKSNLLYNNEDKNIKWMTKMQFKDKPSLPFPHTKNKPWTTAHCYNNPPDQRHSQHFSNLMQNSWGGLEKSGCHWADTPARILYIV